MKKLLLISISLLLVCGCAQNQGSSISTVSSESLSSETMSTTEQITSSTKSTTKSSSTNPTTRTETTSSSKPGSNPYTSMPTTHGDDYMEGRAVLPIGNVQIDPPTNRPVEIKTSTSSQDWVNYEFTDTFPNNDFTYIYGNSSSKGPTGHYAGLGSAFYSYNPSDTKQYPGGLKITRPWVGFQTPMFHHDGEKLEIRLPISQVNNASGKPEKGKDTGYIYFYDSNGYFIPNLTITIEENSIDTKTTELKYYATGTHIEKVGYLEVRFNAQPYKSSQNYNIGLGGISLHSWTYA